MKTSTNTVTLFLDFLRSVYARLKRKFIPLPYPVNPDSKVYIHLGCGVIDSPEFINVDGRTFPHIHHVSDVCTLPMFKPDFADLIYACHILEHVSFREVSAVLEEWCRVVKPGGVLRISVPDFDLMLKIYGDCGHEIGSIIPMLMGGQGDSFDFHRSAWNFDCLQKALISAGFKEIHRWNSEEVEHHDFEDWASREIMMGEKAYAISLNVEAVKC